MPTPQPPTDNDAWRACLPGELMRCSLAQRHARRRRMFLRQVSAATIGTAVVGPIVTGWLWSQGSFTSPPGGIACDLVARLLPEYLAQRLDRDQTVQLTKHLESCPHCAALCDRLKRRA